MDKKITRKRTITRTGMDVDNRKQRQQQQHDDGELTSKVAAMTTTKAMSYSSSTTTCRSMINSSITVNGTTTSKRKCRRSSSRAVFLILAVSMILMQLWMIQRAHYHDYEIMKLSSSSSTSPSSSSSSSPSFLSPLESALKQSFFWSRNRHHRSLVTVNEEVSDNIKDPTARHRYPFYPVNTYPSGINSSSIDWHQPNLVGPEPALPSSTVTSQSNANTSTINITNGKSNSERSSADENDTALSQLEKLKEVFQLKQMQQSSLFKQYKDPLTDPSFNTSSLQHIDWNRIAISNKTDREPNSMTASSSSTTTRISTTTTSSHFKPSHPSFRSSHGGGGHLGVLLDAGRHYFSIEWIKRMIDVISKMGYDMIHFRLTDDQAFNIQLLSQPSLAYPSRLDGNIKVYQPQELKDIVQYAKRRGITIIPEINVPGHAGAWGGVPDLIIKCPNFICTHGYGVLLNLSETNLPNIRQILFDVLSEVIEIFDHPPYLHLGK